MKSRDILLFLCLFGVVSAALNAQPGIVHKRYGVEDGMPSNAISNLIQDSRGYIWIGTWDGLSRFDGYEFVNYKTGAESNIPLLHNRIARLFEDRYGNIWMLMYDEKAFRLNRRTDCFESLSGLFPDSERARLEVPLFARDGTIWFPVREAGMLEIRTDPVSNELTAHYHPLQGLKVNHLFEDEKGTLWGATTRGIRILRSEKIAEDTFAGELSFLTTVQMGECVYWGSADGVLSWYDYTDGRFVSRQLPFTVPLACLSAAPDEKAVYIGTQGAGVFRYGLENGSLRQVVPGSFSVSRLHTDSEGLIWLLSDRAGVTLYDPKRGEHSSFEHKVTVPEHERPKKGNIREIDGTVWVQMIGGGFGYYDRKSRRMEYFHNHPDQPYPLSNLVATLVYSSPEVMWLYTQKRGLDKVSVIKNKVERRLLRQSGEYSQDNDLRAFYYDRDDHFWVSSRAGILYCFNREKEEVTRITEDDRGNPFGRIYGITQDRCGVFWLSTRENGLFRMSRDEGGEYRFRHFTHDPEDPFTLSSNEVLTILVDSQNRKWVATYGGGVNLIEEHDDQVRFLSARNHFSEYPIHTCHKVRTLVEDAEGRIWGGSTEGVLVMSYDPDTYTLLTEVYRKEAGNEASLSSNDIVCIYKDRSQALWLGTVSGGLNKFMGFSADGKAEFRSYTIQDGLSSNSIKSIVEDQDGILWFATEYTICSFDPATGMFSVLSTLEGVDNTLFAESTAVVMHDGDILFGTVNGYYRIDKRTLAGTPTRDFRLQITDFLVNEEPASPRLNSKFSDYIPETGIVSLPHRHSVFTIKFASLDYAVQHRIHYQYKLEGYDTDWRNGDITRRATYTDVPAGDYTFTVRAFLPETPGVYESRSLEIHLPLYFWESTGAFILYGSVLVLLVGGGWFISYRRKMILKKYRVLKIGPSEIVFHDENDYRFVSGLLDWLEKNHTNADLKIEDMVAASQLGRTSFYNRLKSLTQMSPIEFVTDFRLKKAKMYIEKTNCSIADIAYRTGFHDPAYFTRIFKSSYRMTPTDCRRKASVAQLDAYTEPI